MKTTIVQTTRYTTDLGVELSAKPFNDDDVIVTKKNGKLYIHYLVQDTDGSAYNPNDCSDANLFIVNYHRDCDIQRDNIITEQDTKNFYFGNKIPQQKKYWLFKLNAYIHSGVILGIAPTNFPDERWDVSHVGLALVSRKIWKTEKAAKEAAESFVREWNQYLSGDIWGMCTDVFDLKTKEPITAESKAVWGCYDYGCCLKELKKESEANGIAAVIDRKGS